MAVALIVLAPQALAAEALSGDTIRTHKGEIVRLSGIHAPLKTTEKLAEESKQALNQLVNPENASLNIPPETQRDRYGRISTQAYVNTANTASSLWVQGELLSKGLAFVYPPTGNETNLDDMLAAETEARRARRGIWSDPFYLGKPATDLTEQDKGRYAFVRGQIIEAVRIKNKVYLNFGPDWRKDFTIMIAARNLKSFRKANLDPLALQGRTVLVRGWIKHNFGPMIEVTHPAQITITKEQE